MSILVIILWSSLVVVLLLVILGSAGRKKPKRSQRARRPALRAAPGPGGEPEEEETASVPPELASLQLLAIEDIEPATLAALDTVVKDLPRPHPLFTAMTQELDDPEEIAAAVASEPAMAAELLRTVNSAAFALSTPISSIPHAIAYLGVGYVKGIVAQSALADTLPSTSSDPEQQSGMTQLWKASQVSGAVTFALAQHVGLERPSIASTLALLSNLGNMNIISSRPDMAALYSSGHSLLERVQRQQDVLGFNSAIVGFLLAKHWGLPTEILTGLRDSLLALTPPAKVEADSASWQRTLVCYVGCRIGDAVSYEGLRNIANLNFSDPNAVDFFFLSEHLEQAGLARVWRALDDPALRRKLNQSINLAGN
ncbi:MAG: HDOD domain-containing protein [Haliea sp.]|uniref:HDOD domain-containing protein n=1 Tax=Haliea sp. TaxID=1932666 RepID=UPI0032EF52D7